MTCPSVVTDVTSVTSVTGGLDPSRGLRLGRRRRPLLVGRARLGGIHNGGLRDAHARARVVRQ
eukprot:4115055-Prymnesium_polylepis.1